MDNLLIEKARRFMRRGLRDEDAGSWREIDPQDEIATMMADFALRHAAERDKEMVDLKSDMAILGNYILDSLT